MVGKIELFKKPGDFNLEEAVDLVSSPESGGIVIFLGKVRNENYGRKVKRLIYEAYDEMAIKEMVRIREEALKKFPISDALIWHRVGDFEVGENTILIVVAAKHREEAFEACMWIIDEVKKRVPIWKREVTEEGEFWIEGDKLIPADKNTD
ncbi:molybdenum cofactor biosynthesis protein MoaE [Pyrococcus kukulkanii]|uniref:molybdopterin synthase n=1 Tax=Pyrococcus kukulkanii TaxID=1609559 RepID=A0A127B6V3_9EURY|nr:molybdenum cofactor biosynthesis protein MoaE [Pyrococcus kukulkanii]AMM53111.1 molybdenum cofactor biosynthesis protein MoaE [Pyrococcus kukulkanii]